jgi:hypothetical protein
MGSVRFGVPRDLVLWLRDTYGVETFVETGTNRAETTVWASAEFRQVVTVEGYEPLYRKAVESYGGRGNIEFLLGDSRAHIRSITDALTTPAIFWLDAHWCGTETFGGSDECPVRGELEALNASRVPHFVLIDDARLFLAPPPPPHVADQWPDIATICRELAGGPAGRYVAVHEDVIVGVPAHAKAAFIEFPPPDTRWGPAAARPRVGLDAPSRAQAHIPGAPVTISNGGQGKGQAMINRVLRKVRARVRAHWGRQAFAREFAEFARLSAGTRQRLPLRWEDHAAYLDDRTPTTTFDPHYTYHPAWAARVLAAERPARHVDVSSSLQFVGIVSAFVPVDFYDYRPANLRLSQFTSASEDLTRLTFADDSVRSLSCMHTIEHIGLGRYGDPLDPDGDVRAASELRRVLAPGGLFLFVTPVGRSRVCFNAHRVYAFEQALALFDGLALERFALLPDDYGGGLIDDAPAALVNAQEYGCGCFAFRKPAARTLGGAAGGPPAGAPQSMIVTTVISGLGNQLFQYAAGLGLARKLGVPLRIDARFYETHKLRPYELGRFRTSGRLMSTWDRIRISVSAPQRQRDLPRRALRLLPVRRLRFVDDAVAGFDPSVLESPDYTVLRGYWQNEDYFAHCADDVRREFEFRRPPDAETAAVLARVRQGGASVCLHVRRGDYLTGKEILGPAPLRYYQDALDWMRRRVPAASYFVFSDDPAWARENLPIPGATFVTHNTGKNDPEDLRLMAACDHFIIANSTFSWWGAWLSPNPDKLVVAPRQWFSRPNGNEPHIVPGRWVRL